MIKDLHWQHTITSKSSRTAVKGGTRDSQSLRSSNDQVGVPPQTSAAADHAAVLATPAPTSHVRPWPLHKTLRPCQCDLLCFHVLAVIDHPSQGGSFTVCLHAWKDGAITLYLHLLTLCDSGSAASTILGPEKLLCNHPAIVSLITHVSAHDTDFNSFSCFGQHKVSGLFASAGNQCSNGCLLATGHQHHPRLPVQQCRDTAVHVSQPRTKGSPSIVVQEACGPSQRSISSQFGRSCSACAENCA